MPARTRMAQLAAGGYDRRMSSPISTLERAFALAKTGEYPGVGELRAQLKAEGYSMAQLEGPSLLKQLRAVCVAARSPDGA